MNEEKEIKVVIVEDDYLVSDIIKFTLDSLDSNYCIVGKAFNGEEGVKLVCDLKPDIAIMDIRMPLMNGIEATRIIQEKCPTPIIILTSYEDYDLLKQASDAGASAYLIKPLKKDLIERSIIIALARHKDIMEMRRLNKELEEALEEVKTLKGIIPICCYCKKIRDDDGYWENVADYISKHSEAEFSHGICPDCMEKHYGDMLNNSK